ncbi:DNA cytosine methyltransferase [Mesorhizobium sp.]|uniref:DNA cytosine methyltransferase n=1 Tax=Mesorhizobium sp. TaxID=1871066 RepID=UPI001210BF93|nr:DNA cytosine methyltransferase [Mesorhizobium sp.]TIL38544.1 MAG: DNA cytosine methyltransferase [Mesorhizobium sp.]
MKRKMLVADLLCGAGGSSTGAQRALTELGLDMDLVCVNHWPTAIETHTLNHPEARHYVQDIATVRPHLLVPEGYLDLLMASPTCTHHSVARGGKPTSDQQRSDPWHIITWLTELRVKRIIIENVWEFCGWGPVDHRTGKPIASRKGEYFHAWIETLKRLGFDPEWRKLNAADYGDATTRQRFILMARSDGRKVSWPMPTHGRRNGAKLDMFADTKPWRPAREIIDWQIKGRSIFGRKKALAPKTLARIYAGALKFGWPEPFLVVLRQHMGGQSVDLPLPTIAANGGHIALAEPVIINGRKGNKAQAVSKSPIPTLDTKGGVWLAEPFVVSPRHGKEGAGPQPRAVGEPLPTVTAGGSQFAIVEPFVLSQASGGAPRGVSDPIPTAPTGGAHALIAAYYGANSTCTSEGDPLPTVTTKDRFGIVVPVTNSNGGAGARNIDVDPIATMTTAKGGEFAIVMPVTHHGTINRSREVDEPLPTVTGANRGELAFITAQHGERQGQAPRVHDLDNPTPTIAATGHVDLVQATPEFDILFRMLEPHELAAAMGFNTDEAEYEFAGTKTEKIKQIGNAVSVSKMKACVGAIMADAAPKSKPAANDNKEPALAAA